MSFLEQTLQLPNSYAKSLNAVHQFKHCSKCDSDKPPEGGVQMSREKWYCAKCWTVKVTAQKKKP